MYLDDLYIFKKVSEYIIEDSFGPELPSGQREYLMIQSALKTFEFMSCLKFVQWDGKAEDYLHIQSSKDRPG